MCYNSGKLDINSGDMIGINKRSFFCLRRPYSQTLLEVMTSASPNVPSKLRYKCPAFVKQRDAS